MAGIRLFNVHRTWEDWVGVIFGVLIGISPWLAGEVHTPVIAWNTVLVGALVLALAILEFADLRNWEKTGEVACGLWLIASPFVFGYADSGELRYWQFALGAAVILLAVFELWQDGIASDKKLAPRGQ
jgi:hypothetical protein